MFDDGKLTIFRKEPKETGAGRPVDELVFYAEVWYGDINFTVQEYYEARQADTKINRRVRIHQDKKLGDKFVFEIDGLQYDVGRVWHGGEKGVPITDVTLAEVVARYKGVGM